MCHFFVDGSTNIDLTTLDPINDVAFSSESDFFMYALEAVFSIIFSSREKHINIICIKK